MEIYPRADNEFGKRGYLAGERSDGRVSSGIRIDLFTVKARNPVEANMMIRNVTGLSRFFEVHTPRVIRENKDELTEEEIAKSSHITMPNPSYETGKLGQRVEIMRTYPLEWPDEDGKTERGRLYFVRHFMELPLGVSAPLTNDTDAPEMVGLDTRGTLEYVCEKLPGKVVFDAIANHRNEMVNYSDMTGKELERVIRARMEGSIPLMLRLM